MNKTLQINELILNKLDDLEIPPKMKEILKEILKAEKEIEILGSSKHEYESSLDKILQKYADDEDVKEFCSR